MLAASNGFIIDCVYNRGIMPWIDSQNQVYACRATITPDGNPDASKWITFSDVQFFVVGDTEEVSLINNCQRTQQPSFLACVAFTGSTGLWIARS